MRPASARSDFRNFSAPARYRKGPPLPRWCPAARRRAPRRRLLPFHADRRPLSGIRRSRGDGHAGDRGDGRQRFPAESERRDVVDIVRAGDLARGVAHDGELRVFRRHAAAVVSHAEVGEAASGDLRLDLPRPGVHGVFHKFLHGVYRAFDDFSRGDLARRDLVQYVNERHYLPSFAS